MSGAGLYDPTNIMNQDVLNKCQREGWIKLAFYLLSFFFYLYGYNILMDPVLGQFISLTFSFDSIQDDSFTHFVMIHLKWWFIHETLEV